MIELILQFWYLWAAGILMAVLNSAWFKGAFGEFIVNFMIGRRLPSNEYKLFKNVILPTEDGTTQIDHILVSRYGIFVIETQNMKRWIFGSKTQKQWTQQIYRNKYRLQNPLHQNYKHVKTLEGLLDVPMKHIFSVVVFVGDCKLKTKMPENVFKGLGFIKYIRAKREILFSAEDVKF